jgi:hypothetical protein
MSALAPLSLALLAFVPPAPQNPDAPLATYRLLGAEAAVSRTDVALEMALHMRRRDRGKQACEQLADATLTHQAAVHKRLLPGHDEVRPFWEELQKQLRAAGQRPEQFAWIRNSSEAELFDLLAIQMAQERLVRAELGLGSDTPVGGEMLKLWIQQERKRVPVVTDPDLLPFGTAVRVGEREVPLIELGMLLLRTADDDERERFVVQVVYLNTLEAVCKREGITVAQTDLDAAVERQRAEVAGDPRYQGVTFENLIKAEGETVQTLQRSRVFQAQILLDKLVQRRFPDAELRAELGRDREALLERIGPRRRLGMIFVNAMEKPNAIIKRSFPEAMELLAKVRTRLEVEPFDVVARLSSEHSSSKPKGGDIGWHRRSAEKLPEIVREAAFALAVDQVSQPIRADEGCFLVKVLEQEPMPDETVLLRRLRQLRGEELRQQLVRDAAVQQLPTTTRSDSK